MDGFVIKSPVVGSFGLSGSASGSINEDAPER
jgi:hypothetical protein